jgi:hypothetical protein
MPAASGVRAAPAASARLVLSTQPPEGILDRLSSAEAHRLASAIASKLGASAAAVAASPPRQPRPDTIETDASAAIKDG